jgi:hypothetical protein
MTKYLLALVLLVFACGSTANVRHKHPGSSGPPRDCTTSSPPVTKHQPHQSKRHRHPSPLPQTTDCNNAGTTGSGGTDSGGTSGSGGTDFGSTSGNGGGGGGNLTGGGGDLPLGGEGLTGEGGNNPALGGTWFLNNLNDPPAGGGNDPPTSQLTSNSAPEPGTLALLGSTLLGFMFMRRRR